MGRLFESADVVPAVMLLLGMGLVTTILLRRWYGYRRRLSAPTRREADRQAALARQHDAPATRSERLTRTTHVARLSES